jgi:hypothetical protein
MVPSGIKSFFSMHRVILGSALFLSLYASALYTFAMTYVPQGTILDPAGLPGSYTVTPGVSYAGPVTSGHDNEVLYMDGSGNLASDEGFSRNSTTGDTNIAKDIDANNHLLFHIGDIGIGQGAALGKTNDIDNTMAFVGAVDGTFGTFSDVVGLMLAQDNDTGVFGASVVDPTGRGALYAGNGITNFQSFEANASGFLEIKSLDIAAHYGSQLFFDSTGNTLTWDADTTDTISDLIGQSQNILGFGVKGNIITHIDDSGEAAYILASDKTSVGGSPFTSEISYRNPSANINTTWSADSVHANGGYFDGSNNIQAGIGFTATGNEMKWDADTTDGISSNIFQGENILGSGIKGTAVYHRNSNTQELATTLWGDLSSAVPISGFTIYNTTTNSTGQRHGEQFITTDTGYGVTTKYWNTASNLEATHIMNEAGNALTWDADTTDDLTDAFQQSENVGGYGLKGTGISRTDSNSGLVTGFFAGDATIFGFNAMTSYMSSGRMIAAIMPSVFKVGDLLGGGNSTVLSVDDAIRTIVGSAQDGSGVGGVVGINSGSATIEYSDGVNVWGVSADDNLGGSLYLEVGPYSLTLPSTDSTGTQALVSNGSGQLGWATISGDNCGSYSCFTIDGSLNMYAGTGVGGSITGTGNFFAGIGAGGTTTTGSNNLAIGYQSLATNSTGAGNVAIGLQALTSATTGQNTAVGYQSLYASSTAVYNSAFGWRSLFSTSTGSENTAFGAQALYTNDTGIRNVAVGMSSLFSNTTGANNFSGGFEAGYNISTGSGNVLLGYQAGHNQQTVSSQIAIGYQALYGSGTLGSNTGVDNIAIGYLAGSANSTGYSNIFFGGQAGLGNTTGYGNIFTGSMAGRLNTTGWENTLSGFLSGWKNTTGSGNVFTGAYTGQANTTGGFNVITGYSAGYFNTTGGQNIFEGFDTGYNNTTGSYNIFSGYNAGYNQQTASYNIGFGYEALRGSGTPASNTGAYNIGLGYNAGQNNSTGNYNIFTGYNAGQANTTGSGNVFSGYQAGSNLEIVSNQVGIGYQSLQGSFSLVTNTGSGNTAVGYRTGASVSTGSNNSFFGLSAGGSTTTGSGNSFFGYGAGTLNTTSDNNVFVGILAGNVNTASQNTFLGARSGKSTTTGGSNVYIGNDSGTLNISGANNVFVGTGTGQATTTSNNTFIGYQTGTLTTSGSNNTYIGYQSGYTDGTTATPNNLTGATAIGYKAQVTQSNSLILGGTGAFAVNVGIGVTAPSYALDVKASSGDDVARFQGSGGSVACTLSAANGIINCSSDQRLKKDIISLSDSALEKVISLNPVTYHWNQEDGLGPPHAGFIAQEVQQIFPELVGVDKDTTYLTLSTVGMTPYIVKAIQELDLKIKSLDDLMTESNTVAESLRAFLGNAQNKITRIFTGEICLYEEGQDTECITRSELHDLKGLLQNSENSGTSGATTGSGNDVVEDSGDTSGSDTELGATGTETTTGTGDENIVDSQGDSGGSGIILDTPTED